MPRSEIRRQEHISRSFSFKITALTSDVRLRPWPWPFGHGHGLKVNISGHGLKAQGRFGHLGFGLVDGGLGLGLRAKILALTLALVSKFLALLSKSLALYLVLC